MFSILNLHDLKFDFKPYSWIEVKGENLQEKVDDVVEAICVRNKISRAEFSILISNRINCSVDNIQKRVYKTQGYDWYPIPFLIELIEFDSSSQDKIKLLSIINSEIEQIRCGRNSINCKAIKNLTPDLVKLCGAIVADGHLFRDKNGKEGIVIIDEYKDSITKCSEWLEKSFGFKGRIEKTTQFNAWRLYITSKIVTRYFNKFLEVPYGKKSGIVKEPSIIKKSKYRLDFAKGVILMDGSVELDCVVSLGVKSRCLAEDIAAILAQNKFNIRTSYSSNMYKVKSLRLTRREAVKWVSFFGTDTEKGRKLHQMTYGFTKKVENIQEAIEALNIFCKPSNASKTTIKDIFGAISRTTRTNKKLLSKELCVDVSTLYKYLWILEQSKIVKAHKTSGGPGLDNWYFYNSNVNEWILPEISV